MSWLRDGGNVLAETLWAAFVIGVVVAFILGGAVFYVLSRWVF